ncbi:MAG: spermidine/putrescine ABC transporter substrate-binding protein, partial [Chloroflexi bacterium]|nr:spermidine/putrescine ABC transporter substrate-binding protein [Chloroflexota bacterium]
MSQDVSTTLTRRSFLKLAVGATAATAALAHPRVLSWGTGELRVGEWVGADGSDLLAGYESRLGQSVSVKAHASNEDILAALRAGEQYDVVVLTAYAVAQGVDEGLIQPLDRSRLSNFSRLPIEFRDGHRPHDPEDAFSAPKAWGTTGILYRTDVVAAPPASWADFWTMAAQHSGRVYAIDSAPDVIGAALWKLGYPPGDIHPESLDAARAELLGLRKHLAGIDSNCAAKIADGQGVLALGWSSDAAALRAAGLPMGFVIPAEGSEVWEDDYCIPASASNPEAAHEFINYMIGASPIAVPAHDLPFARLMAHTPLGPEAMAARDKIW